MMPNPPNFIVLAAGQGKRMRSRIAKILHPVLFRPMIHYVIDLAQSIPNQSVSLVVSPNEDIAKACSQYPGLKYFVQKEPRGTGDAVKSAEALLKTCVGTVVILSGDVILLKKQSVEKALEAHAHSNLDATVITACVEKPFGYGRIVRENSLFKRIVEEADASGSEKNLMEVNTGIYCFRPSSLLQALEKISDHNKQQEFYLTDCLSIIGKVSTYQLQDPLEMTGINDRKALGEVERTLQNRVVEHWMSRGVTIHNPETVTIDTQSKLGMDVTIESGVIVLRAEISDGTYIESQSRIVDSKIGRGCLIRQGSYFEKSTIDAECVVGPYARLRPETTLHEKVRVGNFVELKKTTIGIESKVPHLSYLGDASIGKNVNVGCGFITCNYDGQTKHQTTIEDNVFVGSDSQAIAPVKIGQGSYIASGSTVTENVPADSLVITRGRQITKPGYARKYKNNVKKTS